jgi:hypothetical protein
VAGGPRSADEVVVVDSIRIPGGVERLAQRAVAWYRSRPPLAQVFLALAAFDLLVRLVGIVGPVVSLDLRSPLAIVASVVPHGLLILLPALIVLRRPDAEDALPGLVDGAIFVALATLLSFPTTALASQLGGISLWTAVSAAAVAVEFVGWIAIGHGLGQLNPARPSQAVAGWANLVGVAILASVAWSLVTFLRGPGIDVGDAELNSLLTLNTVTLVLAPAALAYVARSVVRGLEDERRPGLALRTGAAAVGLAAGLGGVIVLVEVLAVAGLPMARSIAAAPGWDGLRWLGGGGAVSLLVVAFALGLADPRERPARDTSH